MPAAGGAEQSHAGCCGGAKKGSEKAKAVGAAHSRGDIQGGAASRQVREREQQRNAVRMASAGGFVQGNGILRSGACSLGKQRDAGAQASSRGSAEKLLVEKILSARERVGSRRGGHALWRFENGGSNSAGGRLGRC